MTDFNTTMLAQIFNFIVLLAIPIGILTVFLKLFHYQKQIVNELIVIRKMLENGSKKPID